MKVTIITVCYNSRETIGSAFDSVRSQTYRDIEYIVVDGESVDGTQTVINENRDIITTCIIEKDDGLYDAMNKAIKLSTGSIIGILNSDDVFFSETTVEEIVEFHSRSMIDASIGNVLICNRRGNIVRFYSSDSWKPECLRFGFMPPHPSIFFRRELFELYGLYELGFTIGADYELITRFFQVARINWSSSGIITTRMLVGGKSSSGIRSYFTISREIHKALKMNGVRHSYLRLSLRFIWKFRSLVAKVEKRKFNNSNFKK